MPKLPDFFVVLFIAFVEVSALAVILSYWYLPRDFEYIKGTDTIGKLVLAFFIVKVAKSS